MSQQLDMFDVFNPPPEPVAYVDPIMREVATRAYGVNGLMIIRDDELDPFEIEVRGILCLIRMNFGFDTYTVQPAGTLFWSETGYRSWTNGKWIAGRGIVFGGDEDDIRRLIEAYIDAPVKSYGCGGNLAPWWPNYILRWRGDLLWSISHDRATVWDQWGPERHAEIWGAHDARIAAAEARMWAEGIDPNEVGPPPSHKGLWPRISMEAAE